MSEDARMERMGVFYALLRIQRTLMYAAQGGLSGYMSGTELRMAGARATDKLLSGKRW